MPDRLLTSVHWVLFLWFIVVFLILGFFGQIYVNREVAIFGLVALPIYMLGLRVTRRQWFWFPWQHSN